MADLATALVGAGAAVAGVYLTQFVGERYKRFRDGSALAAGILGELKAYDDNMEPTRKSFDVWLQAIDEGYANQLVFRPFKSVGHVYFGAVADKLGLLGSDLVGDVVRAYGRVTALETALHTLTDHHKEMTPAEIRLRVVQLQELLRDLSNSRGALFSSLEQRAKARFSIFGAV